jgi:hypothetical protein
MFNFKENITLESNIGCTTITLEYFQYPEFAQYIQLTASGGEFILQVRMI